MPVLSSPQHDPRSQRGFSMFLVIVAMFVTSMFVAASFAAINMDFRPSVQAKQHKSSYAAAEAGLAYYLKQLRSNPDAWTQCDTVADPNTAEESPINQQWDGTGTDPRTWRKLPGVNDQYTIELLHTPRFMACDPTKQESVVDMSTGTFKVRVSGRSSPTDKFPRSIVATFMRDGFLRFIWFTDQENRDPQAAASSSERADQQASCVNRNRTARKNHGCVEIQFAGNDGIYGPMHTNDESFQICGSPAFGRELTKDGTQEVKTDIIEVSGGTPGWVGCAGSAPVIWSPNRKFSLNGDDLAMPDSNQDLVSVADSAGKSYLGKTIVRLNGTTMDVTNYATGSAVTTTNVPWPGNGVLYVKNNGACNGEIPTDANYDEPNACGNIYVSGSYAKSLTIAAANDVIIRPTIGAKLLARSSDSDIKLSGGSDATLGLIANNFVRVGHRVNGSCGNYTSTDEPMVTNVRIDAAIMSLQHSFMVDNYNCGRAGDLTVNGAIVQRFRGPVGTGSGTQISTGFVKNYWYDDRLRYRSPPYFLSPLKAKWEIQETQEQVKGSPGL
jgi:Tfp pilus assembly protein PilV